MHSKEKWIGLESALFSMRGLESALKNGKIGLTGVLFGMRRLESVLKRKMNRA
jgi:hypothetical protein